MRFIKDISHAPHFKVLLIWAASNNDGKKFGRIKRCEPQSAVLDELDLLRKAILAKGGRNFHLVYISHEQLLRGQRSNEASVDGPLERRFEVTDYLPKNYSTTRDDTAISTAGSTTTAASVGSSARSGQNDGLIRAVHLWVVNSDRGTRFGDAKRPESSGDDELVRAVLRSLYKPSDFCIHDTSSTAAKKDRRDIRERWASWNCLK